MERLLKEVGDLRFKLRHREDKIAALTSQVQKLQRAAKERPGAVEGKTQHSASCEAPCCTAVRALDRAGLNVELLSDLDALWAGQVFGAIGMEVNAQGMTFWEIFGKHKNFAGKIDMVAFREFIRQIFPAILEDRLTRLFYFADVDGSGSLSFLEFLRLFAADLNGNMGSEYFEYVMARAHGAMIKRGGFTECLRRQNRKFGEGSLLGRKGLVDVLVNLNIGLTQREANNLAVTFSASDRNKVDTKAFCDAMAMCASQAFVTEEWVQDLFGQVVRTLHSRCDSLCEALQGATETGYLDRAQFEGFLRRIQPDIRDFQIERLFGYMSATTDRHWKDAELHQGQVCLRHFFNVVCKPTLGATGPSKGASALLPGDVAERLTLKLVNICGTLDNSFNLLDPCLCVDEFQAALRGMGFAPDIDYKHLFNLLDVHRVGRISRTTFVQVLARHIPSDEAAFGVTLSIAPEHDATLAASVNEATQQSGQAIGSHPQLLASEVWGSPGILSALDMEQRLQCLRKPSAESGRDSVVPLPRFLHALNELQRAVNRILTLEAEIDTLRRQLAGTHYDYRLDAIVRTLETANAGLAAKLKAFEDAQYDCSQPLLERASNAGAFQSGPDGRIRRRSSARSNQDEVDRTFEVTSMLQSELSKVRTKNRELQEQIHALHSQKQEAVESQQQQMQSQQQQRRQRQPPREQERLAHFNASGSEPLHSRRRPTSTLSETTKTAVDPAGASSEKLRQALSVYSFDANIVRFLTQVTGLLVLSRFRIDGVQSVESDSVILDCEDLYVKRGVSIKLPTNQGSPDSFMRECTIIAMLGDVAEIQKVYHFPGPWEPLLYCVMEFLRGRLLSERLRATRSGEQPELLSYEAAELCDAVLHGVEQCHKRGVLHLDLKPSVVWEMEQPSEVAVKILDFGLACLTNLSQVPAHSQQLFKDTEAEIKEITEEAEDESTDQNGVVRQRKDRPMLQVDRECQNDRRKVPSEDEHISSWQAFSAHASFSGVGPAWYMSPSRWSGFLLQQQQPNAPRCDLRWKHESKSPGLFIEPGEPGCMDTVVVRDVPTDPQTCQASDPAFRIDGGWYYEVMIGKVWPRCFISCRDVDKPNGPTGCALGFTRTRLGAGEYGACRAWKVAQSLVVGYDGRVFFQGALAHCVDESDPSALSRLRGRLPDADTEDAQSPVAAEADNDGGAEQWPIGPLGWSFAELRHGDRVGLLLTGDCRLVIYVNGHEVSRLSFEDDAPARSWFESMGPLFPLVEVCGCVREVGLDPQPMGPSKEAALAKMLQCSNTVESLGKRAIHMYADTYAAALVAQEIFLSSHSLKPPPTFALLVLAADRWLQQGGRPLGSENTAGLLQLFNTWSRTNRVEERAPSALASVLRRVFDRVCDLDERPIRSIEVLRTALNSLSSWSHVSPDFMKSHMLPQQSYEASSSRTVNMLHGEKNRTRENTWDVTGWKISSAHIRRIIGVLGSSECAHIRYVRVSEFEPNIAPELKRKLADSFNCEDDSSEMDDVMICPRLLFMDVALPTDRCPVPLVQLLNGNSVGLVTRFLRSVSTNADPVGSAPIGVAGALALAEAMIDNSALHELCLARQELGDKGAIALARALPQGCLVTKLDLSSNEIGNQGITALVDALLVPCSPVEHLDLTNNNIGDHGCKVMAHMLLKNESLRHLILQRNHIGPSGAVALGGALFSNLCLQELDLGRNKVGRAGVEMLVRAARTSCTISILNLQDNELHHDAVQGLARMLANDNEFEPESPKERPRSALKVSWGAVSTSLRQLNLRHNAIGSAGARSLLRCLRRIPNSIAVLNLSWNELGADAAKSVANLFANGSHCMLEDFDLRDNRIGGCAAMGLAFQALVTAAESTHRRTMPNATACAARAPAPTGSAKPAPAASALRKFNIANCLIDSDNLRLLTHSMSEFSRLEVLLLYNNPRLGSQGHPESTMTRTMSREEASTMGWEDAQRVRIALAAAEPRNPLVGPKGNSKGVHEAARPSDWIGEFVRSISASLVRVSFGSCSLGNELASEILRALTGRANLQEVDLSDNDLTDSEPPETGQRDGDCGAKVTELSFYDMDDKDEIGEGSGKQSPVNMTYDDEQHVSSKPQLMAKALDVMFSHPSGARKLMVRLGLNSFTDRFAMQIAGSLRRGTASVDLAANNISAECKKAVVAAVAEDASSTERPFHPAYDVLRGLGGRLLL